MKKQEVSSYELFMSALAMLAVGLVAYRFSLEEGTEVARLVDLIDLFLCIAFFLDFLRNYVVAEDRFLYLRTWGLVDLGASIPAFGAFRFARVARLLRVLRALRSAHVLAKAFVSDRWGALLFSVALAALTSVTVSCVAVLQFESEVGHSPIKTAEDVIWWAVVTVSTVGYGDYYPVTAGGRACASVLMVVGIGLFASMAGLVADMLRGRRRPATHEDVRLLRQQIAHLRDDVGRLYERLGESIEAEGSAREPMARGQSRSGQPAPAGRSFRDSETG